MRIKSEGKPGGIPVEVSCPLVIENRTEPEAAEESGVAFTMVADGAPSSRSSWGTLHLRRVWVKAASTSP